jgi:hypothetical protein
MHGECPRVGARIEGDHHGYNHTSHHPYRPGSPGWWWLLRSGTLVLSYRSVARVLRFIRRVFQYTYKGASRLRGSLSHRWPVEMNGVPMRLLICTLSLVVVSGGACAQSHPLPKTAAPSDVARIAAMYSQCLQDWDSGTHLTRQAWERTCRRLMQERSRSALRE